MAANLVPWKKTAPPAEGQAAQAQQFAEMVANLSGSFTGVEESEPWLAPRTEVTRWNPEWYVVLMEKPRQALRFTLWVTAHAVRLGVFVLVVLAVVIVLHAHFSA